MAGKFPAWKKHDTRLRKRFCLLLVPLGQVGSLKSPLVRILLVGKVKNLEPS